MVKLYIDKKEVEVEPGSTILNAAEKLGIKIPVLCHIKGLTPSTSCMVCVVKLKGRENFVPACATKAEEGMEVENDTEAVLEARRVALELLLSEHVGDCNGPCVNSRK